MALTAQRETASASPSGFEKHTVSEDRAWLPIMLLVFQLCWNWDNKDVKDLL